MKRAICAAVTLRNIEHITDSRGSQTYLTDTLLKKEICTSSEMKLSQDGQHQVGGQECSSISVFSVEIPDLFTSIMSQEPVVNPHYRTVKHDAEIWISAEIAADKQWHDRNVRVDQTYLASIWAGADCDEAELRLIVDWNHWVFLFDDTFDEGHLSQDIDAARAECEIMMQIMDETAPVSAAIPAQHPLRRIFQDIWLRAQLRATPGMRAFWRDMHARYFDGLLEQVQTQVAGRTLTRNVEEYLCMRRGTIGADPAIAVTCVALQLDLAPQIAERGGLRECMAISADLVLLVNDILSYKKDLRLGVDYNLLSLLMERDAVTLQTAMDVIGGMLDDSYLHWATVTAKLPRADDGALEGSVAAFLDVCCRVALGNLHWR